MPDAKHTAPTAGADLREQLAAIEHERWAGWQRYMHGKCERQPDGSLLIPAALVARWERQIATSYADLTEAERDSDREQVDRYLPLVSERDFLAACTRERDTVPALDWLAAILTVADARFGALAGYDPQALHTALQASSALLAELRAAVKKAEGGGDE